MHQNKPLPADCFIPFQSLVDSISLPEKFTFPFNYEPHPLCRIAAKELQHYLDNQSEWEHNFGMNHPIDGAEGGKMFGVLVVQNRQNKLGYLAAFSGNLAGKNLLPGFVPPVFDLQQKEGFFKKGEANISQINRKIKELEEAPEYLACKELVQTETEMAANVLDQQKKQLKEAKQARKALRQKAQTELTPDQYATLQAKLIKESQRDKYAYKQLSKEWKERLIKNQQQLDCFLDEIARFKEERKTKSAALQQKLFEQYQFLNQKGEEKTACEIFAHTTQKVPPAGTGDCAAPKLLQYAFLHQLRPVAMAEFWWGQSPKTEVRKHGHFYPACRGKCEPILLGHMLKGIRMDENPLLALTEKKKEVEILFEDEALLVINKPAEFLSVPGKTPADSVYSQMKQKFPEATGPLIVHRLDMSTSGLMLIAKSKETHKILQSQFLKRTIRKRYVALLEGIVQENEGTIDLPLRVDLDNRPRQLVCTEYGKPAQTRWQVIERLNQRTKIHFYPFTGRTHQLRVHSSHPLGLNIPIVGDDLYGQKANRLHLHAEYIEFSHPLSGEIVSFFKEAEF